MALMAEQIKARGKKPGIWAVVIGIGDETGIPLSNRNRRFVPVPTKEGCEAHIRRYIRLLTREWSMSSSKSMAYPVEDAYRDCLLAIKEAIGPNCYFPASAGGYDGGVTSLPDGARISHDPVNSGESSEVERFASFRQPSITFLLYVHL